MPKCPVWVLDGEGWKRGGSGEVELGQLSHEDHDGPSVTDKMVGDKGENVVVWSELIEGEVKERLSEVEALRGECNNTISNFCFRESLVM